MAGHKTDIGSGQVCYDLKPDPIEIGFGCLKADLTQKNRVCNRIGFPGLRSGLGLDLFFFFLLLLLVKWER